MKTNNLPDLRQSFKLSPNGQEAIDLTPILEECMGELDLLQELISLFDKNALEFIGSTKIHLANADFHSLGLGAHKIKAGLAMMRTDSLHAIIVLIEKESHINQDIKHLQFLFNCFTREYPVVKASIDAALINIIQN